MEVEAVVVDMEVVVAVVIEKGQDTDRKSSWRKHI